MGTDNQDLSGKSALVTGGAQGLGLAIAQHLSARGAVVTIADIEEAKGSAAATQHGLRFAKLDVCDEDAWRGLIERFSSHDAGLHILVNNAGIDRDASHDIERFSLDAARLVLDVNILGTMLGCKHAIPVIARSGGGSIVNMSSVAACVPTPFITTYGASKAAVAHLSRSVALHCAEMGYDIRCNSVHPGQVRTPMHEELTARIAESEGAPADAVADAFRSKIPMGTWQEESDIAEAVGFLASDRSRYMTGQEVVIDGGMTLSH